MLVTLPGLEFHLIPIDRVTAPPMIWLSILSLVAVQRSDKFSQ